MDNGVEHGRYGVSDDGGNNDNESSDTVCMGVKLPYIECEDCGHRNHVSKPTDAPSVCVSCGSADVTFVTEDRDLSDADTKSDKA